MNNMFGVIFATDQEHLDNLTNVRTTASVPFGGRYRCIDFTLSNLVNSQVTSIGIVTRYNYASLMDHIRMGRDWDLNRKNGGITVFPPYAQVSSRSVFKEKIEALYGIKDFLLEKAKVDYVILTNSNIIANIDYNGILEEHISNNADITILTYTSKPTEAKRLVVELDGQKVLSAKITRNPSDKECEMGINSYLIRRDLLIKLVNDNFEMGNYDFEKYIIQENIGKLNIYAHHVIEHCAIIDDIKSYYDESMAILDSNIRNSVFDGKGGKIYTRVKDSVPTRYRLNAKVSNSLVADGCDIDGVVENSILFRGVKVEEGAIIKNSIIMEGTIVKKNTKVVNAITDKDVIISEGVELSTSQNSPVVIPKGRTV